MKVALSKQQIVLIVGRKMNIRTADKLVKISLRFAYFFSAETWAEIFLVCFIKSVNYKENQIGSLGNF